MFGLRRKPDGPKPPVAGASAPAEGWASTRDPESVLRRLEWTVVRRLDGLLQGDYRTLFRGFGMDLADLREYQPQDDVRHIDWNVTARLQTPHVREFQEDREVCAWFLLDLTGSVDFGSQGIRKRALSADFFAVLARLLARYGNKVGAVIHGDVNDIVVPARSGRRHVLHVLDKMRGVSADAAGQETDLGQLLVHAQAVIGRRSVVFVVSDFISKPGWEKSLSVMSRRHEVIAVRLYDPMELEMPDVGVVVLQDAETGEQMFVDTGDAGFRRRFTEAGRQRETQLREGLAAAGVDALELSTDDDLVDALLQFTRMRKQRSRLSAGNSTFSFGAE